MALSVVLLIGAGLLIRSFVRLQSVSPGFNPHGVLTFDLMMPGRKYNDKQTILNTYRQLWERLEHLPGAIAAGGVTSLPLSDAFAWTPITVEGRVPLAGEKFLNADERVVGGQYFETMEIPLRRGRLFNEWDERKARLPSSSTNTWPTNFGRGRSNRQAHSCRRTPIQRSLADGGWRGWPRETGFSHSNPRIAFYLAHTQFPSRALTVAFRGRTDPAAMLSAIRANSESLTRTCLCTTSEPWSSE